MGACVFVYFGQSGDRAATYKYVHHTEAPMRLGALPKAAIT